MNFETLHPSLILVNAPQGCGKSHLIRYMMYEMRKIFDYGIVFTNTHFEIDSFDYIDKKFVHPEYNPVILDNLMKLQEQVITEGKNKHCFCIFDDAINASQFKDPVLKRACTQLRHYNMTIIFSSQYTNLLPSWMRSNAMISIIFRSETEINLKALFQSYGQLFQNFNDFKNYIMQHLGNYKFIYYDRRNDSQQIQEKYKIMIAPPNIPKFKIKYKKNLK